MNKYIDFINQSLYPTEHVDTTLSDISSVLFHKSIDAIHSHDFERYAVLFSLSEIFLKLAFLANQHLREAWDKWADSLEVPF